MAQTLTFQVLSDTHLECCQRSLKDMIDVSADVLCLLGDIGSPLQQSYSDFLAECSKAYKYVLVITGNHEYYNTHGYDMKCIHDGITSLCQRFPNVVFLNNTYIDIQQRVRFIGTTLWTHMPEDIMYKAASLYNDYQYIFCEERIRLHPEYTNKLHRGALKFIEHAVQDAHEKGLDVVVLTHHTPTFQFSNPKHDASLYKFGLSTELSSAFHGDYVRYWACGHTHLNLPDMNIRGTTIICNQYGRRRTPLKDFSKSKYYVI